MRERFLHMEELARHPSRNHRLQYGDISNGECWRACKRIQDQWWPGLSFTVRSPSVLSYTAVLLSFQNSLPSGRRSRLSTELCKLVIDCILTVDDATVDENIRPKVLPWPGIQHENQRLTADGSNRIMFRSLSTDDRFDEIHEEFVDLKGLVNHCLHAALRTRNFGKRVETANFIKGVLRLCRKLVTLGMYSSDESDANGTTPDTLYLLTDPLVKLLQYHNEELLLSSDAAARTNTNSLKSAYTRSQKQSEAGAMITTKMEICKILCLVLKLEEGYFVKRFIVELHKAYENNSIHMEFEFNNPIEQVVTRQNSKRAGSRSQSMTRTGSRAGRSPSPLRSDEGEAVLLDPELFQHFLKLRNFEHKAFDFERLSVGAASKRPFSQGLRQLLAIGHSGLTNDVLKLATRRFCMTEHLIRVLSQIKLLADEDQYRDHKSIKQWASQLNTFDKTSSVWIRTQDKATINEICATITNLTALCLVPVDGDLVPDPFRQGIVRLEAVHEIVLRLFLSVDRASPRRCVPRREDEAVFDACCHFIEAFAASNFDNQLIIFYSGVYERLFNQASIDRSAKLATVLQKVLAGNITVVKQISAGESVLLLLSILSFSFHHGMLACSMLTVGGHHLRIFGEAAGDE